MRSLVSGQNASAPRLPTETIGSVAASDLDRRTAPSEAKKPADGATPIVLAPQIATIGLSNRRSPSDWEHTGQAEGTADGLAFRGGRPQLPVGRWLTELWLNALLLVPAAAARAEIPLATVGGVRKVAAIAVRCLGPPPLARPRPATHESKVTRIISGFSQRNCTRGSNCFIALISRSIGPRQR